MLVRLSNYICALLSFSVTPSATNQLQGLLAILLYGSLGGVAGNAVTAHPMVWIAIGYVCFNLIWHIQVKMGTRNPLKSGNVSSYTSMEGLIYM